MRKPFFSITNFNFFGIESWSVLQYSSVMISLKAPWTNRSNSSRFWSTRAWTMSLRQVESGAFSHWMWRCCLLPCTQLKDLIHPDESPMYTLYYYRFSCRSVQQCFWESIAKLVDGFWILTTLFAAFRNCRSVRSNFTAQAHLCFPLSDDPVNRETSQGKPGKYYIWVGRQKCDGQKSPKSVFTGFANELPKASRWRF